MEKKKSGGRELQTWSHRRGRLPDRKKRKKRVTPSNKGGKRGELKSEKT